MKRGSIVDLRKEAAKDPLTEILRQGARMLLAQAVEAEVAEFLGQFESLTDEHGHLPEREVMTGIGPICVTMPRVRDRQPGEGKISFTSKILPPYLRKAKSLEEFIPWLYLKGVSTGDFSGALSALLGPDAPGLSPSTVGRLKDIWREEHQAWQARACCGLIEDCV